MQVKNEGLNAMANENQIINGFDFGQLQITKTFCGKIIEGKGGWDHFLWNIQMKGKNNKIFTTQYKCGLGHVIKFKQSWVEDKPKAPDNAGIMYSLLMDSEASDYSFSEWCNNFGLDSDSISAFNTYQQCEKIAKELNSLFSREELQQMREALRDY